jgi:hypothetical protein
MVVSDGAYPLDRSSLGGCVSRRDFDDGQPAQAAEI